MSRQPKPGRAARHPDIARALGDVRRTLDEADGSAGGFLTRLRGQTMLVACSGGPDSVALCGLLELMAPALELRLAIGHVDHGLRPSSAAEAAAVAALADARGWPFLATRLQLEPGAGLQARAREARRAALGAQARELGARWIALGHTATDQLETVAMHLVRGAGLDGLAAMPAVDAPWLRPLLRLARGETRALCGRLGLAFHDDPSNGDPTYLRVRIREQVAPLLRRENPQLERSITALCEQVRDADAALEDWAAREEEARRSPAEGAELRWTADGLESLPRAIRSRILRRIGLAVGADLDALGHRIIADIDRALLARARARDDHGAALAPHVWELRPKTRVRLDTRGLSGPAPGAANH